MRRPTARGHGDSTLPSTVHQLSYPNNQANGNTPPRRSRRRRDKNDGSFFMISGILCLALLTTMGLAYYFLQKSGHVNLHHHHPAKGHHNRKDTDFGHRNNHVHDTPEDDYEDDNLRRAAKHQHQGHRDSHVTGSHQQDRMKNLLKDPPTDSKPSVQTKEKAARTLDTAGSEVDKTREELMAHLPENSIYRLITTDIAGRMHDLSQYIGKVLLIVNVACEWGLTKVNYEQLQELQSRFGGSSADGSNFSVLAFPSNDFHQELDTNEEIASYISTKFPQVTFPIMGKTSILNGEENQSPIYDMILNKQHLPRNTKVRWNFGKFLINGDGVALKAFDAKVEPRYIAGDIQQQINKVIETAKNAKPAAAHHKHAHTHHHHVHKTEEVPSHSSSSRSSSSK